MSKSTEKCSLIILNVLLCSKKVYTRSVSMGTKYKTINRLF